MLIYKQISKVMAEIGSISKDRKNAQQGFSFRGIDDIYNALHAIMAKHEIFTVPTVLDSSAEERPTKTGGVLKYVLIKMQYKIFASDGSFVEAVILGEAMDTGDKASNKAMSIAHKYLFLQLFAIPTEDDKDPDAVTHIPSAKPIPMHPNSPIRHQQTSVNYGNHATTSGPSEPQIKRLYAIAKTWKWDAAGLEGALMKCFGVKTPQELNRNQYKEFTDAILPQGPEDKSVPAPANWKDDVPTDWNK